VPRLVRRCLYCGRGFITPRRDGRILLGSNYDLHTYGDDECSTTVSVRSAISALVATTRIVPSLETLQLQRVWKGWRPRTAADGQPVVGWSNPQGICVATGFFGLGISLAPVVADFVAELFEERNPTEIAPFSPNRFSDGG
jgi:glycine oxidase